MALIIETKKQNERRFAKMFLKCCLGFIRNDNMISAAKGYSKE